MKLAVIQMSDLHITSGTDYIVEVTNFAHLLHTKKGGTDGGAPNGFICFVGISFRCPILLPKHLKQQQTNH